MAMYSKIVAGITQRIPPPSNERILRSSLRRFSALFLRLLSSITRLNMLYLASMVKQDNYLKCMLCPHQCGVNRRQGERGICAESATVRLAWVGFHKGEEPPLVEKEGS